MRPPSALLVALLFVTATALPVAAVAPAPTHSQTAETPLRVETINNTTNQLTIPDGEVRVSTHEAASVDVATAVQTGSDRLHQRQETLTFEMRFRQLDTDAQRTALVAEELAAIRDRQAALDDRQDAAMRRFATGEISARQFLQIRLLVHAEATELLASLERIDTAPDTVPGYSLNSALSTQHRNAEGELRTLSGPVADRLYAATVGSSSVDSIYVEASADSYLLATVDDGRYVRETRLDGERAPSSPDQFLQTARNTEGVDRFNAADERAAELYTWLYERQRPSFTYYGTTGIYELTANHPNGELTAYLDGATTNVFYEEQFRDLSGVETTATETHIDEGVRVTVQRSTRSGPMLVAVTDDASGEAVDAAVAIGGQPVGSTGSDGALWTVEPDGPYTVNVTASNTNTTVTVPP